MPIGKQKVKVLTANENLPLEGATVITKTTAGEVIATQITDADGLTEYLTLQAPNKSLSQNEATATKGYSTYDVDVQLEGFHTVHVHGVQIIEGENSYLPVAMHPCSGECFDPNIYVPENAVGYNESSRSEQGATLSNLNNYYGPARPTAIDITDTTNSTASVTTADDIDDIYEPPPAVLQPFQSGTISGPALGVREVFVPRNITVRLGAPTNNSARNVTVPFVEYIANVASSEIFASWPLASLEANIHAITTFALNRLYTEWYRSRGFNFDITNTTQFDQFFVYGRNIFENLMQISARIFDQYVRRIGFQNPLFTTYRANACGAGCLSQWGTVDLARQGLNSLQILRHFYGNDVELSTANRVQDVRTTYPGTPLQLGSSSRYVQLMQSYLNRIRQNFPLIPLISSENGVFGADTHAAVREFQAINGLNADGVIGAATWNRITQIWVGVTNLADINSEGVRIGIGATPPTVTLSSGSSGNDVRKLQWLLNYIAEYYQVVPAGLIVDGRFGSATQNSVREFQRNFGLNPDGIVGSATWQRLYEVFARIQSSSPDPAPMPPPEPPPGPGPEPPPPPETLAPDRMQGTVTTNGGNLNLRSAPSATASIIDRIPNGTPVVITGEWGGFYHIVLQDSRTGWVSSDFVTVSPRRGTVTTNGGNLNLRGGPSATSPVIGSIPNRTTITATDIVGNFYQVTTPAGFTGWASRSFIVLG